MSERAAPFYCPYCGDEDLRPHESGPGAWECAACNRAFRLKFLGLLTRGLAQQDGGTHDDGDAHSGGGTGEARVAHNDGGGDEI